MSSDEKTMLAAQWTANNTRAALNRIPRPVPRAGEVLLRVKSCSMCHTDCFLLDSNCQGMYQDESFTLGHEVCGELVAHGPEVDAGNYPLGQRYSVHCVVGRPSRFGPQIFQFDRAVGIGREGGYAAYMPTPASALVPVPDNVSDAHASVASCAGVTSYHAVHALGKVKSSDAVLILGAGGLGSLAAQLCLLEGAHTIVVSDLNRAALDRVQAFYDSMTAKGLTTTKTFRTVTPAELDKLVSDEAKPLSVNVVVDFVGAQSTVDVAFKVLKSVAAIWPQYGRYVLVGIGDGRINLSIADITIHPIQILPSSNGSLEDLAAVLQLFSEGKLEMETDTEPLQNVNKIMDEVRNGSRLSRVVITPPTEDYA